MVQMQEKEKLNCIFPEAFGLWPPQTVEDKVQGLNDFTESKGWKTKSQECVLLATHLELLSPNPTAGKM